MFNGPMRIERTSGESSEDDYRVYLASGGSWVETATMIYVDQPVGTGFSYATPDPSKTLLTTMDEAVTEFMYFLN